MQSIFGRGMWRNVRTVDLVKRDICKQDFDLGVTLNFPFVSLSPYKSRCSMLKRDFAGLLSCEFDVPLKENRLYIVPVMMVGT
jgi:hypothetical protein